MLHKSSGVKHNSYFSSIRIAFIAKSMVNLNIFLTTKCIVKKVIYTKEYVVDFNNQLLSGCKYYIRIKPNVKILLSD